MISARIEEITLNSPPVLWNAAIEWWKRAPFLRSRFQNRLKTATIAEQETICQTFTLDLLRLHRGLSAIGGRNDG